MSEPTDELLDVRMRGETETVMNETTQPAADGATTTQIPVADDMMVFLPLLMEETRARRSRALIWNCLAFLAFLVTVLAVVPLVIAFIRLGQWLYGL